MFATASFPQHKHSLRPIVGQLFACPVMKHGKTERIADQDGSCRLVANSPRPRGRADSAKRAPSNLFAWQKEGGRPFQSCQRGEVAQVEGRISSGVKMEMPCRRANGGNAVCLDHTIKQGFAHPTFVSSASAVASGGAKVSRTMHGEVSACPLPPTSSRRLPGDWGGIQDDVHLCERQKSYRHPIGAGRGPGRDDGHGQGVAIPFGSKSQAC